MERTGALRVDALEVDILPEHMRAGDGGEDLHRVNEEQTVLTYEQQRRGPRIPVVRFHARDEDRGNVAAELELLTRVEFAENAERDVDHVDRLRSFGGIEERQRRVPAGPGVIVGLVGDQQRQPRFSFDVERHHLDAPHPHLRRQVARLGRDPARGDRRPSDEFLSVRLQVGHDLTRQVQIGPPCETWRRRLELLEIDAFGPHRTGGGEHDADKKQDTNHQDHRDLHRQTLASLAQRGGEGDSFRRRQAIAASRARSRMSSNSVPPAAARPSRSAIGSPQ